MADYFTFFSRIETAFRDIIRQKLIHTTRQIDWTQRIVTNWQILQTESPEIDRLTAISYLSGFDAKYHLHLRNMPEHKPHSSPYSDWVLAKCCDTMINHIFIQLSPQMRLFSDYEIEYLYFYLEHLFLSKTEMIQHSLRRFQIVDNAKLSEIDEMINPKLKEMRKRKNKKKSGSKGVSEKKNELLPPIDPKEKYIYLLNEAQRLLCLGIFELIQTFYQINKECDDVLLWSGLSDRLDLNNGKVSKRTVRRLGDESVRYAHRFDIFTKCDQPSVISYQQFRTTVFEYDAMNGTLAQKFKQCQSQFGQSKKYFNLLRDESKFGEIAKYQKEYIENGEKVAIINWKFALNLYKIIKQCKANEKENIDFEIKVKHKYEAHEYYPQFYIDESK